MNEVINKIIEQIGFGKIFFTVVILFYIISFFFNLNLFSNAVEGALKIFVSVFWTI